MIHVAIVEDELAYANQLEEYIQQYQEESGCLTKVSRFSDGEDIVDNYHGNYDIIFMDIQMKFMDGMTAAEKIRQMDKEVILMFITNMTQYAIRGYEVDAMDYIVKPVEYFAFSQKISRAIERLKNREQHFISVPIGEGVQKLDVEELYYLESRGHSLLYHSKNGIFESRGTMKGMEISLEPYGFFRCSKGFLVNMRHVDGIKGSYCIVRNSKISIGRAKKKQFMDALANYMSEVIK